MGRSPRTRWWNACRMLLLGSSLLALCTAALYRFSPATVDRLDRAFEAFWRRGDRQELQAALAGLPGPEAVARLQGLVERLAPYRSGDHQAAIRRLALRALVPALAESGPERALPWAEDWLRQEPRDLEAHLWRSRLLDAIPARRPEALAHLRELHRTMPEVEAVTLALAAVLVREESWHELGEALRRHLQAPPSGFWLSSFRRAGSPPGFPPLHFDQIRPRRTQDGTLLAHFELPVAVEQIRIVLPEGARLALAGAALRVREPGRDQRIALDPDHLVTDLEPTPFGLQAQGGKGRHLDVTLDPPTRGAATFTFSARATPLLSPAVAGLLLRHGDAMLAALPAGDAEPGGLLAGFRAQAALQRGAAVYLRSAGQRWSADRRRLAGCEHRGVRDGSVPFELVAALGEGEEVAALRIDLPESPGPTYRIDEVLLETAGGTRRWSGAELPLGETHDLSGDPGAWHATGSDPYFALELPSPATVTGVRVRGVAR